VSEPPVPPDRRYVAAIEAAWSKLAGRAIVVSRRDYETVAGWHRRGIPLPVILEAFAHFERTHRRRSGPRSLAALARAVEEGWETIAQGRAAVPGPAPVEAGELGDDPWADGPWKRHPALAAIVSRIADGARRGEDAASIDAALDRELPEAVPAETRDAAEANARRALAPYRPRMSPEAYRVTLARGVADRLRQALGLPRRALCTQRPVRSPERGD
jgi:hypothetical protein